MPTPTNQQSAGKRLPIPTKQQKHHFVQIDISGAVGSGKSTLLQLIGQCLSKAGYNVHLSDRVCDRMETVQQDDDELIQLVRDSTSIGPGLVSISTHCLAECAPHKFVARSDLAKVLPGSLFQRIQQLGKIGLVPSGIETVGDTPARLASAFQVALDDQQATQGKQIA